MTRGEMKGYLLDQGWELIEPGWIKSSWVIDGLPYEDMALRQSEAWEQAQSEEEFITL